MIHGGAKIESTWGNMHMGYHEKMLHMTGLNLRRKEKEWNSIIMFK